MSEENPQKDPDTLEELKRMRDELELQMNLGKAEAKAEWAKLEVKWREYELRQHKVKNAVDDTGREVDAALDMIGDELKKGYERIRDILKD
jgi:hypothetical protein